MEIEVEEVRGELQGKLRLLGDYQDQVNDLKVELASVREQKNSAMKEVRCLQEHYMMLFSGNFQKNAFCRNNIHMIYNYQYLQKFLHFICQIFKICVVVICCFCVILNRI